jgi:MFS family permease
MLSRDLIRNQSWTLAAIVAFSLFLDYFLYGVHLLLVTHSPAGLNNEEQLAWLYGAYAISVLVVTPLFGWLGDLTGSKPILLCGVALAGAAAILFSAGSSFQVFVWARLCQGAASAALWTSGLALIAAHYVERRVEMIGYAFTGSTAGSVLGPVAGGFLSHAGGYKLPFLIIGILLTINAVFIITLLPRERREPRQKLQLLRRVLLDKSLAVPALAVALAAFAVGIIEPLLPARLARYGTSSKTMGVIFAVSTLVYGLSAPVVGRIAERLSINRVIAVGAIGMAATLPLLAAFRQAGLVCLAVAMVYISFAFMLNPASAELGNVVDRAGMSCYSAAYAVYNVVYSIGMLATAALASAAAHILGFLGALLCISALLLLFIPLLMSSMRITEAAADTPG